MRSTFMIALAASLVLAGCDRKEATPTTSTGVGGGPTNNDNNNSSNNAPVNGTGANNMGTGSEPGGMAVKDASGAESLAGGGAKTTAGANGPAMNDKPSAGTDAGK